MTNIAVCDLTKLFMDELEPIARDLGISEQYRKMSESEKTDFSQMEKYLRMLYSTPECSVPSKLEETEPYRGSKETIKRLKEAGYSVFIVTDDVLMSLPENNRIIREKLDVERIIPTAEIRLGSSGFSGLENARPKHDVLKKLVEEHSPSRLMCMVQGANDYDLALSARELGGTVVSVNSHSPKLEGASDYHVGSIAEMPGLLERIFAENAA